MASNQTILLSKDMYTISPNTLLPNSIWLCLKSQWNKILQGCRGLQAFSTQGLVLENIPVLVFKALLHFSTAEIHFIGELEMRPSLATQDWGLYPHSSLQLLRSLLIHGEHPTLQVSPSLLREQNNSCLALCCLVWNQFIVVHGNHLCHYKVLWAGLVSSAGL